MKIKKLIGEFSVGILVVLSAHAQGTFQNLNFESADLSNPSGPFNEVPIASALPGWSGSIDGTPVTQIWANDYSLGAAAIDVFGPGWNSVNPGIIGGSYSVFLQAFYVTEGNVSLWQNGTVPVNAESLQFSAWNFGPKGSFSVSFAGNSLSPVVLSSGQTPSGQLYDVYGVNIAPYAGQTGQLEFTALDNNSPEQIELDDIAFSPTAVPEPTPLALTGIGALLFALYRRFSPKRP
jgi:hypothetical protein